MRAIACSIEPGMALDLLQGRAADPKARDSSGHALAAAFPTSNSISAAQPAASPLPAEAPSWLSARIKEEEKNGLAARRGSVVLGVLSPEGEFFRSFSDPGNPQTAQAKRPGAAAAAVLDRPGSAAATPGGARRGKRDRVAIFRTGAPDQARPLLESSSLSEDKAAKRVPALRSALSLIRQ